MKINSSAIGLNPDYEKEDAIHIRDLVIKRMEEAFPLVSQDVPVKKHKVRNKPNTFPKVLNRVKLQEKNKRKKKKKNKAS